MSKVYEKKYLPVEGVFNFQIDIPHRYYGGCDYCIPADMYLWLKSHGLPNYGYGGDHSSGDGYTNGVTNKESVYIVRNATQEDGLAFQIQFPFTRVHISQQYDYK